MKALLSATVLALFFLAAAVKAADDCSKTSDACKAPQTASPFLAEVKKVEKVLEIKQGKSRQAEIKMPPPTTISSAPAAAAPTAPAEEKGALSKPGWLLAVFALLAGLYYFLKEGKKRAKK